MRNPDSPSAFPWPKTHPKKSQRRDFASTLDNGCTIPAARQLHLFLGIFDGLLRRQKTSKTPEGRTMDRSARLHVVGKISYYLGWISLVCGGLLHLGIGRAMFTALSLTKRNLFEVAVVCFLICMASEVRALSASEKEVPVMVKRPAAA